MIIRIVKMTFKEDAVADFLQLFDQTKEQIRNFEGCTHLELLQQADATNVFFTYGHWKSVAYLNNYRNSNLFNDIWPRTKALFEAKAEAWTTEQKVILK